MFGLSSLYAKVLGALAAIGAILVAVLSVFNKGKKAGQDAVIAQSLKKEVEDVKTANKVENEVAAGKPGAAADKLRKSWSRD